MRLKVYNNQYDRKDRYFFEVPKFHYYEGEPTTVKWAGAHELAFKTPDNVGLRIIQRRNIKEIDGKPYEYQEKAIKTVTKIIQGSKGANYEVTVGMSGNKCTCPGFTFRGKCRHVDELATAA